MRTAVLCLVCTVTASPAFGDEEYVDPYSAKSASGKWVLRVEPSDCRGSGAAEYRMVHGAEEAWKKTLDCTLRECVVSEKGVVIGYAYDNGYTGWGGKLVVLAIGPDGRTLLTEPHDRDGPSMAIDPPPPGEPQGEGVLIDELGDRAIVRLATRDDRNGPSEWRMYSLADGHPMGVQKPTPPRAGDLGFSREIDSRVIPGTGLVGVHWVAYDKGVQSACIELIDREGKIAWTRTIDKEYEGRPKGWSWWQLKEDGIRQLEVGDSMFSVVSYSEKQRTKYRIDKGEEGKWLVTEMSKEPAEPAPGKGATAPAKMLTTAPATLRKLGETSLATPAAKSELGRVRGIQFDGKGNLGWVEWGEDKNSETRFVIADRTGKRVSQVAFELPTVKGAGGLYWAWLDGSRWVLARGVNTEDASTGQGWFLDATSGKLVRIEGFQAASIKRICRMPRGERAGFVVLGSLFGAYTIRDQVMQYDEDGKLLSSRTEPGYGRGQSIQDVAVLTDGALAMMTGWADRCDIQISRPGRDPETWNVAGAVAEAPREQGPYFGDIRADKDGGLIVQDTANHNYLHRLDRTGKRWTSLHVSGPKGEEFRLYDNYGVDPDGRIWGTDYSRLYRAGDDGRADLAFGGPADGTMAEPVALTLDKKGWIYAVERGTAAVHVFDEKGKPIRVMRPEPGDTPIEEALSWIVVEPDGSVRYRMHHDGAIVTFGPDGKRVGSEKPKEFWERERVEWQTVRGGGWEQGDGRIRRIAPEGESPRVIRYRPDGGDLVSIEEAAAAPDGSLAVLSSRPVSGSWFTMDRGPRWLCLYGPKGEPLGAVQVQLPFLFGTLYYDGKHAFLTDCSGVTVVDTPALTMPARRIDLVGEGDVCQVRLRPDGTLTSWKEGARVVEYWALPEK